MVERAATEDQHGLARGFAAEMLREWRDVNKQSLHIQNGLPPDVLARIVQEDRGFDPMAYVSVAPRRMHAAQQWLEECIAYLDDPSVSHPSGMMVAEPSDETTRNGARVERGEGSELEALRAEVVELDEKVDRLELMVTELLNVLRSPRGSEPQVPTPAP